MAIRLQGTDWVNFTTEHINTAKVQGYYKSNEGNICLFIKLNRKPYKHWCSSNEKQVYLNSNLTKDSIKCLDKFGQDFYKLKEPVLIQDIFKFKLPIYKKDTGVIITEKQEKALTIIDKYLDIKKPVYFYNNKQVNDFINQHLKLI